MRRRRVLTALFYAALLPLLLALWLLSGNSLTLLLLLWALLLPPISLGVGLLVRPAISVTLQCSPTVPKGSAGECAVRIRNASRFLSARLELCLRADNLLTGESAVQELSCAVPPGGTTEKKLLVQSIHCGGIRFRPEKTSLSDVCGLLRLPLASESTARMTVLPELFAPHLEIAGGVSDGDDNTEYLQRRGHDLSEVLQLREYVPGDELRAVHWKLSGKLDRLIVREAAKPLDRSLLLLWDKNAGNAAGAEADCIAETVCSVAQSLSEEGYAFTLGWSEESRLILEEVEDAESLLTLLPGVIRDRGGEGESAAELLLKEENGVLPGRILYFAAGESEALAELRESSRVTAFLAQAGESESGTFRFTPENYRDILQNLELTE